MAASSTRVQPLQLITLDSLESDSNVSLDFSEIPQGPKNRRSTNGKWLIIFVLFLAVLFPFLTYTCYYSDIRRVIWGYDKCGNICGQKNSQWDEIKCSGKRLTKRPYLQYDHGIDGRHCVLTCSVGYIPVMGRCLKEGDQEPRSNTTEGKNIDLVAYFVSVKWQIVISCSSSVLVTIGIVLLFRYAEPLAVWGIMIGCTIGFILVNVLSRQSIRPVPRMVRDVFSKENPSFIKLLSEVQWYQQNLILLIIRLTLCKIVMPIIFSIFLTNPKSTPKKCFDYDTASGSGLEVHDVVALVLLVYSITFIAVLKRSGKKIQLLICLLKESNKAVFDMPGLMIIPVITCIVILIVTILAGFLHLVIYSAGTLQNTSDDLYEYVSNPVIIITMVYNAVLYLWICRLCTSIQYMIISGAISKWYFTRDKNCLTSPIMTSVSIVFRFHLGTAALGTIIIPLVQVIKTISWVILKRGVTKEQFNIKCRVAMEKWFRVLYKTSYIVTVMHGQAFIRSGRRAFMLIIHNIRDILELNFFGDRVFFWAKVFIVGITLLLAMGVFAIDPGSVSSSNKNAYYIIGFISYIFAWVSLDVFETIMDTLFICYCEDSLLNDGIDRPYFISANLKEFIDSSKEYYRSLLPPTISVDNV